MEEEKDWRDWLRRHRHLVEASGLPELVLSDSEHWYDFLDHGTLDHHEDPLRFSVDDLSIRRKATLLRLLMTRPSLLQTIVGSGLISAMVEAVEQRYKD